MQKHEVRKVRLETHWRTLTVTHKQPTTPQLLRALLRSAPKSGNITEPTLGGGHGVYELDSSSLRTWKAQKIQPPLNRWNRRGSYSVCLAASDGARCYAMSFRTKILHCEGMHLKAAVVASLTLCQEMSGSSCKACSKFFHSSRSSAPPYHPRKRFVASCRGYPRARNHL